MQIEYQQEYPAPAEVVWNVLLDPEILARHLPGCKRLDPEGDGAYLATLEIGLGPVRGTYTGKVAVKDLHPHSSYRLLVEGGGGPGQVKGEGVIQLVPTGHGSTLLRCVGDATVTGTLAAVGQRLLGTVARMIMGSFFNGMGTEIAARAGAASSAS